MDATLTPASTVEPTRAIARRLPAIVRTVLGLGFVIFGLNGFLNFLPAPTTPPPESAMAFAGALFKTGYMFPLIKGTELAVGLLLVANRFVPLALVLLAPVLVNIIAFHAFLSPDGFAIPLVLVALELYLAWSYRDAYRPLLAAHSTSKRGRPGLVRWTSRSHSQNSSSTTPAPWNTATVRC